MLALLFAVLASVGPVQNPPVITPDEAAKHVGQVVVVRGEISQIVLSVNLTTHINFGGVYPNHVFTDDQKANQMPFAGVSYEGKDVEVRPRASLQGKPRSCWPSGRRSAWPKTASLPPTCPARGTSTAKWSVTPSRSRAC
jgi:hypothetical protein